MAHLNKVMLIGRLTDNPEPARTFANGGKVVKFRFAVGRSRKNPQTGQWESDPNPLYIDCEAWNRGETGKTADIVEQYLSKGREILIDGHLKYEQWEKDGQKRSKHVVVADRIEFLGSRQDGDQERGPTGSAPARGGASRPAPRDDYGPPPDEGPGDSGNGDIPF